MNSAAFVEDHASTDSFRLPESCTGRLCYAQRIAPTGERAYGHFIVEAQVLADAVWQHIDSPLLDDTGPDDVALHRWLRNPERVDDQPEMLPSLPGELDTIIGQLFTEGRARAFCVCCNRNVAGHEVRRSRSHPLSSARQATRYRCSEGHLLLDVETGVATRYASKHAA